MDAFDTDFVSSGTGLSQALSQLSDLTDVPDTSTPPRYLLNFLRKSPAKLTKPRIPSSRRTKPFQWFDLHMHDDLKLKRVHGMPDFTQRLLQFLNVKLDYQHPIYNCEEESGISDEFSKVIQAHDRSRPREFVYSENAVVQAAHQTLIACSRTASALLFGAQSWGDHIVSCAERASGRMTQPVAKADRFIFVDLEKDAAKSKLSPHHRADVDLLQQHGLQNFLVYEFKNLDAGDLLTMDAVASLFNGDPFPYTSCPESEKSCNGHKYHLVGGRLAVTGHNTTLDARYDTLFNLSSHTDDLNPPSTPPAYLSDLPRADESSPDEGTMSVDSGDNLNDNEFLDSEMLISDASDTSEYKPSTNAASRAARAKKTKRTLTHRKIAHKIKNLKDYRQGKATGIAASSSVGRGKILRPEGEESIYDKARYIIQQAWGELVYNDATFIVISSGNYEIIGMRDRATQTLYLSPVITTFEPGFPHNAIHTALVMLSYYDAVDRARQMEALTPEAQLKLGTPYSLLFDQSGLEVLQEAEEGNRATAAEINKDLLQKLQESTQLQCDVPRPLFQAVNAKVKSNLYRRTTAELLDATTPQPAGPPKLRLHVCNDPASESDHNTRIVYYNLSEIDDAGNDLHFFTGNFIMKFSIGADTSKKALQEELDAYRALKMAGVKDGLPQVFGIYKLTGSNAHGLLMLSAGMTLEYWLGQPSQKQIKVIKQNKSKITNALQSLHDAGWKHGNLYLNHVVISETGDTAFVSLRHAAKVIPDGDALEEENSELQNEMNVLKQWIAVAGK